MKHKVILTGLILMAGLFMAGTIDLNNLYNYANQTVPNYINKDNTTTNAINDQEATLGRVLFYDKNLSVDNSTACASCHIQQFAFGDTAQQSQGMNGVTGRHSMRLINTRFADEDHFFWDERANTLEDQVIQPIQDHTEMGFSGQGGDPDFDSCKRKIAGLLHYQQLFNFVYNDTNITTQRIQNALAQFVRSIQSFDAKYDVGRAQVNNDNAPFPNFTAQENSGKQLFMAPPQFNANGVRTGGGLGCRGCHRAPEFDIDPQSDNNGVIGNLSGPNPDLTNTRSPSLRDVVDANGNTNSSFMHTGVFPNLTGVLNHYNTINNNANLDNRLRPNGNPQNLSLTTQERNDVIAFLATLTGTDVYTNPKWSDPFTNGNIQIGVNTSLPYYTHPNELNIYPNPAQHTLNIDLDKLNGDELNYAILTLNGSRVQQGKLVRQIDISSLSNGTYMFYVNGAGKLFVKQ